LSIIKRAWGKRAFSDKLLGAVSWWHESVDAGFLTLITDRAIVHTSGMPMAYSFGTPEAI